jgi:hypothetical protein
MEDRNMKRTLIACTVLVALAFFVVPALAAPSPLHRVTWRGSGVSDDNPLLSGEITGNQVKFDGVATQDSLGIWSGKGTIVDRRGNLKADLVISDVTFLSEDRVYITGENAAITANGVRYRSQAFGMTLDRSSSEFQLYIEQNLGSVWLWWIPGSAVRGSIRIT